MAKVLVTGGAGFIGSHLSEKLVKLGHRVSILDDLSTGSSDNLVNIKDRVQFVKGSVTRLPQKVVNTKVDCIFHLATHPRSFSLQDPFTNLQVNAKGMLNVLELARKYKSKVIYTSNSGIYGEPKFLPIDESHPVDPKTPYDANKLVGEYYCTIYSRIYGISTIVFRLATVYGERQRVSERLNWRPVIAEFCSKILSSRVLTVNGDGKQTRDFVYVGDVVQGLIRGFESNIKNDMFNLSTGVETSLNDLLATIAKITGLKVRSKKAPELVGDIRRMCYSWKKCHDSLGYKPAYSLEDGVRRYISWLKTLKKR